MAYTEAQKKATIKYQKEHMDHLSIRYPRGTKAMIQEHAEKTGEKMSIFVLRAIRETIERDNARAAAAKTEE